MNSDTYVWEFGGYRTEFFNFGKIRVDADAGDEPTLTQGFDDAPSSALAEAKAVGIHNEPASR